MHGLYPSTSLRGRAVSFGVAALLSICIIAMPPAAAAQNSVEAAQSFSVESGEIVDMAFDLAAEDDMPGAIRLLDELALKPGLTAFERSSVSQMIGAYNYELGHLFEAKVAFDAALDAGGLTQKELDGMKPILANIDALDKLGLLKPKPAKSEPKPESALKAPIIIKTEPVPEQADDAVLMASAETRTEAALTATAELDEEPVLVPSDELIIAVLEGDAPDTPIVGAPIVKEAALKDLDDDRDAQPLTRVPPEMPRRFLEGDNSGYCDVRFNVSPEGTPVDVDTTRCTDSELERSTVKSVEKWTFSPKIVNGRAVSRSGVEAKVRYVLTDERGKKLPLPSGY